MSCWLPYCFRQLCSVSVPADATNIVSVPGCWHSYCFWRFLFPDVITVAGLPAIAGVPTVGLVTAAAGVIAIARVPADHGVHILVGFIMVLNKNLNFHLFVFFTNFPAI
jgi:hypothetical protein